MRRATTYGAIATCVSCACLLAMMTLHALPVGLPNSAVSDVGGFARPARSGTSEGMEVAVQREFVPDPPGSGRAEPGDRWRQVLVRIIDRSAVLGRCEVSAGWRQATDGIEGKVERFVTDGVGTFSMRVPDRDVSLRLKIRRQYGQAVTVSAQVPAEVDSVSVDLPSSRLLQGRVIDARTSEPVVGATVLHAGGDARVASDANGRFVVEVSCDTTLCLVVTKTGYGIEFVQATPEAIAGRCAQEAVISLYPEVTISGRLTGCEGMARAVRFHPLGRKGLQPETVLEGDTRPDGSFRIGGIAAGMRGHLVVAIGGIPWVRWHLNGSQVDRDVGVCEVPRCGRLIVSRGDVASSESVRLIARYGPSSASSDGDKSCVPFLRELDWPISGAVAEYQLPVGAAELRGSVGQKPLAIRHVDVGSRTAVDLQLAEDRDEQVVRIRNATSGRWSLLDDTGRPTDSGDVYKGFARVSRRSMTKAVSFAYYSDMGRGWTRAVVVPWATEGEHEVAIPVGDFRLGGALLSTGEAPCQVLISGEVGRTRISYSHGGIVPKEPWSIVVPAGFSGTIRWRKAEKPDRESDGFVSFGAVTRDTQVNL